MNSLSTLIDKTLEAPVDAAFAAAALHIRETHPGEILAILGYGSAMRGVAASDTLLDLYVLTRDFKDVSQSMTSRIGCRLVPPNVYYMEFSQGGQTLRAKYAALPLYQFTRWMQPDTANPYFWARFCQPARLLYSADEDARHRVVAALAAALRTMYGNAKSLTRDDDPLAIFRAGFAATYLTELRPESAGRGNTIVDNNQDYFRAAGQFLVDTSAIMNSPGKQRIEGKLLSILRLAKAAFTFSGGADYAAWKIARHTGQAIELTAWQRRHPLLAGLLLLPRLLRSKALR
jgi:hypothetical protein